MSYDKSISFLIPKDGQKIKKKWFFLSSFAFFPLL